MAVTTNLQIRLPSNVIYFCLLTSFFIFVNEAGKNGKRSLYFIEEPPRRVSFLNSLGAIIKCSSSSGVRTSTTTVTWHLTDGELVREILNLRYIKNGSLVFAPFTPDKYRHDVHSVTYRCRSTSSEGKIVSRPVNVKAVVMQPYQARVYDEYVIKGNTGVLKCQLPGYVSDEIIVTGWVREDNFVVDGNENGFKGKYTVFPDGHLHINNVEDSDAHFSYWCRTKYRTDNEEIFQLSETSGRLLVADDTGNSIAPRITHIRQRVTAIEGQSFVLLPCAGQGYPVPSFRWINTMETIKFSRRISVTSGTLIIKSVSVGDSGHYTCEIYNNIGSDLKATRLIVREPLRATIDRSSQTVLAGDRLTLKCRGTGSPIDTFEWFKDGRKLIFSDGRLDQQRNSSYSVLEINSVSRRDDGLYQCFVSNTWETSHAVVKVTLSSILPEIVSGFESRTLQSGPTVKLKCTARGKPTPKIQWTLDNIDIVSVESVGPDRKIHQKYTNSDGLVISELVIKSIRSEDGGEYSCTASNKIGRATHKARINVYGLPHVRQLNNVKVTVGDDINVTCHATGYPIHRIYWTTGSKSINGRILSLKNVRKKQAKILYSCVAVGSGGKQSKEDLKLRVLEMPEIRMGYPEDVTNGREISMFCIVVRGDKPVSISWIKDGNPIKHHLGIMTTKSSDYAKLHINEANTQHSGNYTCISTNEAGTVSKSTIITVKASPVWINKPINTTSLEDRTIFMHCRGNSNPKASVTWQKILGNKVVNVDGLDTRYKVLDNGTLRIFETKKQDSGLYKCAISNGIPPDLSHTVRLNIGSAPVVQHIKEKEELKIGDSLEIYCRTSSVKDSIKVKWFRDNDLIEDPRFILSRKSSKSGVYFLLQLKNIKEEDAGVYGCIVSNDFGETSTKIYVSVKHSNVHRESIRITTQLSNQKPTLETTAGVMLAETTKSQLKGTDKSKTVKSIPLPTIKINQSFIPGAIEKPKSSTHGGFRWKKYMLYYVVPAGIIIAILVVALVIVLCLLCCPTNKRKPQDAQQIELHHKQLDNYKLAGCSEYDETLVTPRYGKVGTCRDKRPLSGSYPNLPAADKHYLGFSPYGTLEHQTSHYTPAPR